MSNLCNAPKKEDLAFQLNNYSNHCLIFPDRSALNRDATAGAKNVKADLELWFMMKIIYKCLKCNETNGKTIGRIYYF